MADNRLFLVDTETSDIFMLCKSLMSEWGIYNSELGDDLDKWLQSRDTKAADNNGLSNLVLRTEDEIPKKLWDEWIKQNEVIINA